MTLSLRGEAPFGVKSALPQDSSSFQGNGDTSILGYHARRIVGRRACRGHLCAISVPSARAYQLANSLHLLPHWTSTFAAIGTNDGPRRIRVDIVQIDVTLNHMPLPAGLDLHFTEAQRGPLLFHGVLPIDHLPAHRTLIGGTLTVGCRTR